MDDLLIDDGDTGEIAPTIASNVSKAVWIDASWFKYRPTEELTEGRVGLGSDGMVYIQVDKTDLIWDLTQGQLDNLFLNGTVFWC